MDNLESKKRKLPRHVDGRIMVGPIPIKNFLTMLPIAIAIVVLIILFFNPVLFFAGVIALGILISLFGEFHQRETGFSIIKDVIRYSIEGDKIFERKPLNARAHKRFTKYKIKRESKG